MTVSEDDDGLAGVRETNPEASASSQTVGPVTIECQKLFDGWELHGPSRIEVDGGVIRRVMPIDPASVTEPATDSGEVVRTHFVAPGLIDAHVHISGYTEALGGVDPFHPQKSFAAMCVFAGVTTLRDVGNSLEALAYAQDWSERHQGPRIIGAGPVLDSPPLSWPFSRVVRDEAEAGRVVERLSAEGVAWIKLYRGITPDVGRAVVEEASRRGLPVASHCGRMRAAEASSAGVRSIEHIMTLLPDLTGQAPPADKQDPATVASGWSEVEVAGHRARALRDTLKENGTWLCPTLLATRREALVEEMVRSPFLAYAAIVMPYHKYLVEMRDSVDPSTMGQTLSKYMRMRVLSSSEHERVISGLDRMAEFLLFLLEGGVPMACGSDSPNPSLAPGFSLHEELIEWDRCGVPPLDVMRSATGHAGRLLGQDDLGCIREGGRADLICLAQDPSKDVKALRSVQLVMVRGTWVDRPALAGALATMMQPATSS